MYINKSIKDDINIIKLECKHNKYDYKDDIYITKTAGKHKHYDHKDDINITKTANVNINITIINILETDGKHK